MTEQNFSPSKEELQKLYSEITPIKISNNCYAYVMGVINSNEMENAERCIQNSGLKCDTKPQPGYISGIEHWRITGEHERDSKEIMKRVLYDSNGKIYIPNTTIESKFDNIQKKTIYYQKANECKDGYYKGALVIENREGGDYHFYRQMNDKTYTHKPGTTQVTNTDASKHVIYDPQFANRDYSSSGGNNYSIFCTYFCIPHNKNGISVSATQKRPNDSRSNNSLDKYVIDELKKIKHTTVQHITTYQSGGNLNSSYKNKHNKTRRRPLLK